MQTGGPIPLVELEQRLQRLRLLVHPFPRVALRRQPLGHARDRQLVGVKRVDLVPGQRRRHLGAGTGAHRPRAEDGLVRRVLVVVDEDAAAALLLPPGRGDQLGAAPLELARGGDRRRPHLVRVPARLEPDVDVQAAVPGRLRVADHPELVEQAAELAGRGPHVVEVDARLRVEVEAQLVRDIGAVVKVRPDVEAEARQVHGPDDVRHVGENERAGGRPVRRADDRRLAATRARVSGTRFWKNELPSAPCGKRCIRVGRPPAARMSGSATAR